MAGRTRIAAFGGSLRNGSYSRALLHAAKELAPENAEIEILEIKGFPEFNQDLERDPPEVVREFKARVKAADAILISTPEYNYSVPGYLKNVIDWCSRPYGDNSLEDKPVALMSEGGALGGSRAQYHMRQILVFLNTHPINKPEVIVTFAKDKIIDGVLKDEPTREHIRNLLISLVAWTERIGRR